MVSLSFSLHSPEDLVWIKTLVWTGHITEVRCTVYKNEVIFQIEHAINCVLPTLL